MKTLLSFVSFAALTLAASASTPTSNPTQASTPENVGMLPEFVVTASRTETTDDGRVGQMAEMIVVAKADPAKKSSESTKAATTPAATALKPQAVPVTAAVVTARL